MTDHVPPPQEPSSRLVERTAAPMPASAADWLRRLLLALVLAAGVKAFGNWLHQFPVLALLGTTSIAFVSLSVLFGWAGLAAATAVQVAYMAWRFGLAGLYTPTSVAGYALAGGLAWITFRRVPRLGRGLPTFRSLRWFALVAAAGALLSSTLISLVVEGHHAWSEVALWSRSTIVSVWLFVPPLMIAGDAFLRRWLAPIPGEEIRPAPVRVRLVTATPLEGGPDVETVTTRQARPLTLVLAATAAVGAITLVKVMVADGLAMSLVWWNLLYVLPIFWLAQRLLLPGGLVAAGLAGFASMAGDAFLLAGAELAPGAVLGVYAQLLVFWLVGGLVGRAAVREAGLAAGLAASHERLRVDLQRVVRALTGALEATDEYTEGHLQRVNVYALEVGGRLGLDRRQLELLQIAAALHDIGKIGISEAILNKSGPLDDDERAVIQRHPEIGARLLARLDGLRDAAPLVLHHQERWDGRREGGFPGYPAGLAGEAIPLGARIIAVVDAFDAMTTDRPYRAALPVERARQVLRAEAGHQFDPRVVATFSAILDERPWG